MISCQRTASFVLFNCLDLVLPFAKSAGKGLGQVIHFFVDDLDQEPGDDLHRAMPGCAFRDWERDGSDLDPVFTLVGFYLSLFVCQSFRCLQLHSG